jgi:hypothetical protein
MANSLDPVSMNVPPRRATGQIVIYPCRVGRRNCWRWRIKVGRYSIERIDLMEARQTMKGAHRNAVKAAGLLRLPLREPVDLVMR